MKSLNIAVAAAIALVSGTDSALARGHGGGHHSGGGHFSHGNIGAFH